MTAQEASICLSIIKVHRQVVHVYIHNVICISEEEYIHNLKKKDERR